MFASGGNTHSGFNVAENKMMGGLPPSAGLQCVSTEAGSYRATFTYDVSGDAMGAFLIDVMDTAHRADYEQKSFITSTGLGMVEINSTQPAVVVVTQGSARGLR